MANLNTALDNIFTIYDPEIVAVHTTCLSEVIGDDIPMIIEKAKTGGKIPEGKTVIHTNTPSFVGSHVTGFSNQCASIVKYLAEKTGETKNTLNVYPGWVEPADMREIKRIAKIMGVDITLLPDTSDVLDTAQDGDYKMYPDGGTTIEAIKASGDSYKTLALGPLASTDAATTLEKKCGVPFETLDLPIGISATDDFVNAMRLAADVTVPSELEKERGRVVDLVSDMSQYLHEKKVAIYGDPDQMESMCRFLVEIGMTPAIVITGTPGKKWEKRIKAICEPANPDVEVRAYSDIHFLHQWIKNNPVDLLIGNAYGKFVSRAEGNLPFVRFGFPIMDRVGHRLFPTAGYTGAMYLLEKITDALLAEKDLKAEDQDFELIL